MKQAVERKMSNVKEKNKDNDNKKEKKEKKKYRQDGDEGDNEEGGREIKMSITKVGLFSNLYISDDVFI